MTYTQWLVSGQYLLTEPFRTRSIPACPVCIEPVRSRLEPNLCIFMLFADLARIHTPTYHIQVLGIPPPLDFQLIPVSIDGIVVPPLSVREEGKFQHCQAIPPRQFGIVQSRHFSIAAIARFNCNQNKQIRAEPRSRLTRYAAVW